MAMGFGPVTLLWLGRPWRPAAARGSDSPSRRPGP
jgi:hypothetical protein